MGVIKNIKGNKIFYKPQGFLDAAAVSEIITPVDINLMQKRGIKCVLIDFSKIISTNMNALHFLNDIFENLYKKHIDCVIFNANNNVFNVISHLDTCYFNYYENEEVMRVFCDEEYIPNKPVFLCCMQDEQNKNMLIFYLVRKGITPIVVNSETDIGSNEAIVIRNSFISKVADRVNAIMKNGVIYFYFNGFLDANVADMFDLEYYRRNLLIGFKVFVFDMNNVKGMNIK
jgi:anti-anti-sigma regulatory factor